MRHILEVVWRCRTTLVVVLLIAALVTPQPAKAQFGIDLAAIVAAINSIGSAITNVIGTGLRAINGALGTLRTVLTTMNTFFNNVVYPLDAINRARGLVGAVQGFYTQIQALSHLNVASATLAAPKSLEQLLLSRNPLNVPAITNNYQNLYQTVPVPANASPETRDLIDMTDATAQAAMKRSIAIDAIADTEMQAADRINQELQSAAPGTAPMVEAEAAAWLVRANAYTQSALGDVMRVRAVALANAGAALKFNAAHAAQVRQNTLDSLK